MLFGSQEKMDSEFETVFKKLENMKTTVNKVKVTMQDPKLVTFVAVAIPEFLSVYETERLMEELMNQEIDIRNLVVNNVLYPED